jgi:hypothetical protein
VSIEVIYVVRQAAPEAMVPAGFYDDSPRRHGRACHHALLLHGLENLDARDRRA